MLVPSLFRSPHGERPWSVLRAAGCGAAIGVAAGLFKALRPLGGHEAAGHPGGHLTASLLEIGSAMAGFALLCAGISMLRNFISRRLVWREGR